MNPEEFENLESFTDEQIIDFIKYFDADKQWEFIKSTEFKEFQKKNNGYINYLIKNVKKHNISFLLKLFLDGIAESSIDNFKTFLDSLQEKIYKSDAETIQQLLDELNRREKGIPLPVSLISKELSTHFSEDGIKELLETGSLLVEWDAIRASCSILKQKAFERLKNLKEDNSAVKGPKTVKRRLATEKLYQDMNQWYTNCRQIDSMSLDDAIKNTCQKFNRSVDTVERALGLRH